MSIGIPRPDSFLGQIVGGYKLAEYVGTGATGLVFRGERVPDAPSSLERTNAPLLEYPPQAAIKVLIPPLGASEEDIIEFRQRFLREARTLKRLEHPNILPIIDYGEDTTSGFTYMILRYMPGGSLATKIAVSGPLAPAEVSAILGQIAAALDYAHAQSVIHRDVKPGNILLDASGTPYLCDFSIARLLSDFATHRTTTGRMLGTPAYMSPEQFDDSSKVTGATDVYSLGMVAYEMLTGHVAFNATSWAHFMKQHLQEPPPPLSSSNGPNLPAPAEAAIMHALEKRPEDRYLDAMSFVRAFADGLQGIWTADLEPQPDANTAPTESFSTSNTQPPYGGIIQATSAAGRSKRRMRVGVGASLVLLALVAGVILASTSGAIGVLANFGGQPFGPQGLASVASPTPLATFTPLPTLTATPEPTATPRPKPTATPKPKVVVHASLGFCGLCHETELVSLCNSGTPYSFTSSGDLENTSSSATARWTLYFTPSGWTASPSHGTLAPHASVTITVSSATALYPGQKLTAHFTCNDGSGTPCPVYGWQSAGPC